MLLPAIGADHLEQPSQRTAELRDGAAHLRRLALLGVREERQLLEDLAEAAIRTLSLFGGGRVGGFRGAVGHARTVPRGRTRRLSGTHSCRASRVR